MSNTNKGYTLTELHIHALELNLNVKQFYNMLYDGLVCSNKNKKTINNIARELNIYPRAIDVVFSAVYHLTSGVLSENDVNNIIYN